MNLNTIFDQQIAYETLRGESSVDKLKDKTQERKIWAGIPEAAHCMRNTICRIS